MKNEVAIYYYLNNKEFALRVRCFIPRVGDLVLLTSGRLYKVEQVIFVDDKDDFSLVFDRYTVKIAISEYKND